MLVISRECSEEIGIGVNSDIVIKVVNIGAQAVDLAITSPPSIRIVLLPDDVATDQKVISRRRGESLQLDNVRMTVVSIGANLVQLGITCIDSD